MTAQRNGDRLRARLQNIDPYEFEDFVADLWEQQGWETNVSQDANDQGVDVVARKSDGMIDQKLVIQTKRYSDGNKIGRPKIQQYHALKQQDSDADAAVVVTTSSFTAQAEEWANEHNVKLIDGDDLVDIIEREHCETLVNEYSPALDATDESTVDPAGTGTLEAPSQELPGPLEDEEVREKASAVLGITGGVFLLMSQSADFPAGLFGLVFILGAMGLYFVPYDLYDMITPDREVYRTFADGSAVFKQGDTIKYAPDDNRSETTFDAFDGPADQRRQANIYGELDQMLGGLEESPPGAIPTDIASEGQDVIAAYRFAIHDETPEAIASDMGMTQQEIVTALDSVVSDPEAYRSREGSPQEDTQQELPFP